jgi:hypothetical protein
VAQGLAAFNFKQKRFARMRMKNAALFAIGFLSVHFWLHDSARCQTSSAPPLSLARPAPSPDETAPPPAIIRASPEATDDAPPPKATARRSAPPVAAKNATSDVPAPKPAADYDGFTTGAHDEPVAKLPDLPRTTNRSKPKKEKEPASVAAQPSADDAEDEQLRRKLTICRDCK